MPAASTRWSESLVVLAHQERHRPRQRETLLDADEERIGEAAPSAATRYRWRGSVPPPTRLHPDRRDVRAGQLLDIVPDRGSADPMGCLAEQTTGLRERIEFGALDLSGPCWHVFEIMVRDATPVAEPIPARGSPIPSSTSADVGCRTTPSVIGGRESDPRYRCRPVDQGKERLDNKDHERRSDLLRAGDPQGDVATVSRTGKPRTRSLHTPIPTSPLSASLGNDETGLRDQSPLARTNPAPLEVADGHLRGAPETRQSQSTRKQPVFLRDRGGGALAETWW